MTNLTHWLLQVKPCKNNVGLNATVPLQLPVWYIHLIQAKLWQILCSSSPKFVTMATEVGSISTRLNFRVWNSHRQRGHETVAISDAAFSAVRSCSYTVRLLSDS